MERLSVRERICQLFETRFKNVQEGVGGYSCTWDIVTRKAIDPREMNSVNHMIGIYDVREKKEQQIGATLCKLQFTVEFFFKPMLGDVTETYANTLLAEVSHLFLSGNSTNNDGLTLDVEETGSDIDTDTLSTNVCAGIVTFVVTYRHKVDDPFSLIGE